MEDEGVTARYGTSQRYGEYISYELVDVPDQMANGGRKCKARSYTLGEAYGVDALRDKLREKAAQRLRTAEQRNNATEARDNLSQQDNLSYHWNDLSHMQDNQPYQWDDLFHYPQPNELNTKTAAQDPNCAPEMKRNPEWNKDVQTVRDTINAAISDPQQDNVTEAPISTQPVNGATAPPTAAEGTDSPPERNSPHRARQPHRRANCVPLKRC